MQHTFRDKPMKESRGEVFYWLVWSLEEVQDYDPATSSYLSFITVKVHMFGSSENLPGINDIYYAIRDMVRPSILR